MQHHDDSSDDSYQGPERRSVPRASRKCHEPSLAAVWEVISELNSNFSAHMEEERQLQPHLAELVDILQKSKGVFVFLKFIFFICAPITALAYWVKDHVKL
jgi:hypothetical protein